MGSSRFGAGVAVAVATAALCACSAAADDRGPVGPTTTVTATASPSATSPASSTPAPSTSSPATWQTRFADLATGVVRLDVSSCSGVATGTGFLVAPHYVATVAHVVLGGGVVRVTAPKSSRTVAGDVAAVDLSRDLALVHVDTALDGHQFSLATTPAPVGTEIGVIGFPLGRSMQLTVGHVTGVKDRRTVTGIGPLSDIVLSDAAINPGNSGGPWVDSDGDVVAVTESGPPWSAGFGAPAEGNNGGVSAASASIISAWLADPGQAVSGDTDGCASSEAVARATTTLDAYFNDINQSDYESAYAQLDPTAQTRTDLATFVAGVQSSQDTAADGSAGYDVVGSGVDATSTYVDVAFTSTQDAEHGPDGQTCTDWTLRYHFADRDGVMLIHDSPASPGTPGRTACAAS